MGHTRADLRSALRALVRAPGFAATAILSIAIGIGANTAIFSVASALLLRPLPYSDAERLVIL
jgi:putative ABC transport system permease protein